MGWFSKKEEVPEIPPAPELPELQISGTRQIARHELPSLPPSTNPNTSQEMVKSAVGSLKKEVDIPPVDDHLFKEHEELIPSLPNSRPEELPRPKQLPKPTRINYPPIIPRKTPTQSGTIFVKISDFQQAQKDFDSVRKQVREIEKTLSKVKEVKVKEDQEIGSWIQELEKIKSRLSEIDSNIFNRV